MIPIAGSAYTYGYATLGEFVAWIIGWDLILEYLVRRRDGRRRLVGLLRRRSSRTSASTCRRVDSGAAQRRRHAHLVRNVSASMRRTSDRRDDGACAAGLTLSPACSICRRCSVVLMTTLLVIGIKESARFNNVIVVVKVAIVLRS